MKKYLFISVLAGAALLTGCGESTPEQSMSRAVALAENGQWEKAGKIAEKTVSRYPELAEAQILRAVTAERCGSRDIALDAAVKAVKLAPESFEAQYTLGRLYAADIARSSEAEQTLLKAYRMRRSDTEELHVKILLCNVAMGANSPRTSGYLGLLAKNKALADSAVLNNQLAVNYVRRGNYKAAHEYFNKAFTAGRKDPDVILNVARFYDGCLRNRDVAQSLYAEYLRISGKNAPGRGEASSRIRRLRAR